MRVLDRYITLEITMTKQKVSVYQASVLPNRNLSLIFPFLLHRQYEIAQIWISASTSAHNL